MKRINLLLLPFVVLGAWGRLWLLFNPATALDSDESVVGLMALNFLRGDFSTFFWGQAYGGSHDAIAASAVFAAFGPSAVALKSVALAMSFLAAFLTWRIGRRTIGEPGASIAGVLMWVWPPFFIWFSVKEIGIYWVAVVIELAVVLLLLRLRDGQKWPLSESAAIGFLVANAFWANYQTAYMIVPAAILTIRHILKDWKRVVSIALGGLAGLTPWLLFNVRNSWPSLDIPAQPALENSYGDHLLILFKHVLPTALGSRVAFDLGWLGGLFGITTYTVLLGGLAFLFIRRPRPIALPLLSLGMFPWIYAMSPYTWYFKQPRYLLFIIYAAGLLIGWALAIPVVQARKGGTALVAAGLVAAAALSVPVVFVFQHQNVQNYAYDLQLPASFEDLNGLMRDENVDVAYADYWVAYRATFENEEEIIVVPIHNSRYQPYETEALSEDAPPYIFLDGSGAIGNFKRLAGDLGLTVTEVRRGPWVLAFPSGWVPPRDLCIINGQCQPG